MRRLLTALSDRGWKVRPTMEPKPLLPPSIIRRYPKLPSEVIAFLSSFNHCCNQAENSWFLTSDDYARQAGSGFRWNDYECMALEADTDPLARAAVSAFWDSHFPFMLAVHSDYDYLAIRLGADSAGSVVHGYAPEWECPSLIAPSFAAFLEAFTKAAASREPEYPLRLFL
jgi:hypothetical protein